ncbi:MAG: JAB domain-containing protein [Pseudomonadota bacterium]
MLQSLATCEPVFSDLALGSALPAPKRDTVHNWQERRSARLIERLRELVLSPTDVAERFHVAFLDSDNHILSLAGFGDGCADALYLNLRELFRQALCVGARNVLIAHNHPSGNCRPSEGDIKATMRIAAVAHALEIEILDHLIFSHRAIYSMRKGGEL